ncbi:MAG: tetratricopeptide repeat protein [Verrucomicrobiota bacterium]
MARAAFALMAMVSLAGSMRADGTNPPPESASLSVSEKASNDLQAARAAYLANTNDATKAWQLGRASFVWSELLKDPNQKEKSAREGMAASRQAIALAPKLAAGHYYLGLTIGQFADTKRNMAALKMVKEMEREFFVAKELDEHFDFAGPDRNLGILYYESPGVISIGSHSKARKHLQQAVDLAPEFPENHLNLAETLLKLDDAKAARRAFEALEKTWPAVPEKFKGDEWNASRADWQKRFEALKGRFK